jgi:16S rRNA (guanine527-N7)-methyltransferase
MKEEEFNEKMKESLKELNIELSEKQLNQFYNYMNILIEWNKVMNLTNITEPEEIIQKHFVDSLTILKSIKENDSIIDVGTGAGFPGIPIKIVFPETRITLLDSLNKRIKFLEEVINKLELKNIETIHGRAEEVAHNKKYREKYDIAIARAVAPLNVLSEYLLPFVKIGGYAICMKGVKGKEEAEEGKNAIKILGGEITNSREFNLPNTEMARTIIEIEKIKNTEKKYPRKAGTPTKMPL